MKVEIVLCNEQTKIDESVFNTDWLSGIAEKCLELEGIDFDCEIGLTFTDDEKIRELNLKHRGLDRATDVLSFPLLDNPKNPGIYDVSPEGGGMVLLGDIVISLEMAERQAEEYGHGYSREVAFLIVHSMMHLLGYDHMEDEEREIMRGREEAVLQALQILR